jgi:hypothetical protein
MVDNYKLISDECSICLEKYSDNELIRILPCQHYYHKLCIDKWFISRILLIKYCPFCKKIHQIYQYLIQKLLILMN